MSVLVVYIAMIYVKGSAQGISFDDQLCGGVARVVVTERDIQVLFLSI